MIYIHLNHPCREVDVWDCKPEWESIARGQGYVSIEELREALEWFQREQKVVEILSVFKSPR